MHPRTHVKDKVKVRVRVKVMVEVRVRVARIYIDVFCIMFLSLYASPHSP